MEETKKRGRPKGSKNKPKSDRASITRAQAIRLFCEECTCWQLALIRECPAECCPLWPYRMGKGQEHTDVQVRSKDA